MKDSKLNIIGSLVIAVAVTWAPATTLAADEPGTLPGIGAGEMETRTIEGFVMPLQEFLMHGANGAPDPSFTLRTNRSAIRPTVVPGPSLDRFGPGELNASAGAAGPNSAREGEEGSTNQIYVLVASLTPSLGSDPVEQSVFAPTTPGSEPPVRTNVRVREEATAATGQVYILLGDLTDLARVTRVPVPLRAVQDPLRATVGAGSEVTPIATDPLEDTTAAELGVDRPGTPRSVVRITGRVLQRAGVQAIHVARMERGSRVALRVE